MWVEMMAMLRYDVGQEDVAKTAENGKIRKKNKKEIIKRMALIFANRLNRHWAGATTAISSLV